MRSVHRLGICRNRRTSAAHARCIADGLKRRNTEEGQFSVHSSCLPVPEKTDDLDGGHDSRDGVSVFGEEDTEPAMLMTMR